MKSQIKKTIAISLLVCFLVSLTATAVSASRIPDVIVLSEKNPVNPDSNGHAYGTGHDNAGGNEDPGSNAGGNALGAVENGHSNSHHTEASGAFNLRWVPGPFQLNVTGA